MPSHPGHIKMYQAIYQHMFCLSQLFTSKISAPPKPAWKYADVPKTKEIEAKVETPAL